MIWRSRKCRQRSALLKANGRVDCPLTWKKIENQHTKIHICKLHTRTRDYSCYLRMFLFTVHSKYQVSSQHCPVCKTELCKQLSTCNLWYEVKSTFTDVRAQIDSKFNMCSPWWCHWLSTCCQHHSKHSKTFANRLGNSVGRYSFLQGKCALKFR